MRTCTICRFAMELDDTAVLGSPGRGICLGCYARAAETTTVMPKALRRQLIRVLAQLEAPAA